MNTYNTSMFDSIRAALNTEEKKGAAGYRDILQMKPGNTYTVRLIPNVEQPANTFFHYFNHGWNSLLTGNYVQALSPITFNERDPIAEERYRVGRVGTDEEKEKIKVIRRSEHWLAKVYVVEDPTNPDNNGKVKMIRYGKQIDKIIKDAIQGEMAEEFGEKIFDLTKNGCNFKIKVEKQTDQFPTYTSSRFTTSGSDLKLSKEQIQEIYETAHKVNPLNEVNQLKSYDELKKMLNEHFYCKVENDTSPSKPSEQEVLSNFTKPTEAYADMDGISDEEIENILRDV